MEDQGSTAPAGVSSTSGMCYTSEEQPWQLPTPLEGPSRTNDQSITYSFLASMTPSQAARQVTTAKGRVPRHLPTSPDGSDRPGTNSAVHEQPSSSTKVPATGKPNEKNLTRTCLSHPVNVNSCSAPLPPSTNSLHPAALTHGQSLTVLQRHLEHLTDHIACRHIEFAQSIGWHSRDVVGDDSEATQPLRDELEGPHRDLKNVLMSIDWVKMSHRRRHGKRKRVDRE